MFLASGLQPTVVHCNLSEALCVGSAMGVSGCNRNKILLKLLFVHHNLLLSPLRMKGECRVIAQCIAYKGCLSSSQGFSCSICQEVTFSIKVVLRRLSEGGERFLNKKQMLR